MSLSSINLESSAASRSGLVDSTSIDWILMSAWKTLSFSGFAVRGVLFVSIASTMRGDI